MPKPLVLITEPIAKEAHRWLANICNVVLINVGDQGFETALLQADGLVVRTYTRVDQKLLDQAPNLKVVGRAGVGLDNIDLDACSKRSVQVVHTPRANAMAVVEYTMSMLINTLRPLTPLTGPLTDKHWHQAREDAITPRSVVGSTLGIIGLGHIGSRVARAAGSMGMKIHHHDLRTIDPANTQGSTAMPMNDLIEQCQCICLHVDGRNENHNLISNAEFSKMRSDVVLINASRGFVVDPHAAASFARNNPNARLILDVHDPEPIQPNNPLLGLDNVILTPHIAAATRQAKIQMSWVVRDVWEVLKDSPPSNQQS